MPLRAAMYHDQLVHVHQLVRARFRGSPAVVLPPLVVLHGTADGTTNVKYAEEAVEWVKKAKGLGTPTTTVNAVSASYTGITQFSDGAVVTNTYDADVAEYGSTCNGEYAEYSCSQIGR